MGKEKSKKMKEVYAIIYTKEKGKLEFTYEEWDKFDFDVRYVTIHREYGPAIIWNNGTQEYWINRRLHREDGPAIIWDNGKVFYYLNHRFYSEEDYYKKLKEIDNLPLSLKLIHAEEWVRNKAKK